MDTTINSQEITLMDIMKVLKKNAIFIVSITILCTALMIIKIIFFTTPVYQATTTAVLVKGGTSNIKDTQYTASDINLYQQMMKTYAQIATSNLVVDRTSEELKNYSSSQLRSMVNVSIKGQTQIIQLSVTTRNRGDAANIANVYLKNFIQESMNILPVGEIRVLDKAKEPTGPIPAGKFNMIMLGFLTGIFIAFIVVFIRHCIDNNKIRSEKQVLDTLDISVVATIK